MRCYSLKQILYQLCYLSDMIFKILHVKFHITYRTQQTQNLPQFITLHEQCIVTDSLWYHSKRLAV